MPTPTGERAKARGARITLEPLTQPFGERQYNAEDFAGHSWSFSQSVADRHPVEWGGKTGAPVIFVSPLSGLRVIRPEPATSHQQPNESALGGRAEVEDS
jgi:hypothetical protein